MPRLLPKLQRALAASKNAGPEAFSLPGGLKPEKKRRSISRQLPIPPQLTDRTKSILLDEIQLVKGNRENEFVYHKKLPPQVRVMNKQVAAPGEEVPREMTEEERSWYSSPWCQSLKFVLFHLCIYQKLVRMLSSPIRQCIFTNKYLPSGRLHQFQ
jgi:hypothetical protein